MVDAVKALQDPVTGHAERGELPGLRRVPDLAWFVMYAADEADRRGL
jgi:hypothetical protein